MFSADPGVVVDTPGPVRTPDGINLEGASYIVIDGFTVIGMPRTGIRSVTNDHVTIRNNIGDKNGRWGIFTGFSDDLLIEDNEMLALGRRARHLRLQQRRPPGHPRQQRLGQLRPTAST